MSKRIMVCPECGNLRFHTTAHVMQEWEVDERGCFISVSDDCLEVTHRPDRSNTWTCSSCGKEAISMTYLKEVGGIEIYYTEDYRKGNLFIALKSGNKTIRKGFFPLDIEEFSPVIVGNSYDTAIEAAADALLRTFDIYTKDWLLLHPEVIDGKEIRLESGNYFLVKTGCSVAKLEENKIY